MLPAGALPARVIEDSGRAIAAAQDAAVEFVLDRVLPARLESPSAKASGDRVPTEPTIRYESPATIMQALLARSLVQNTATSRSELYVSLLRQLVPDEARIVATLAEAPPSPLVHVYPRGGGEPLIENASLIGRTASVTVPSLTPRYVTHLRDLGLVTIGPAAKENDYGYELLLADADVRRALKHGQLGKLPARVVRKSVTLSALGGELWRACTPSRDEPRTPIDRA
jgi:hypothetical protein